MNVERLVVLATPLVHLVLQRHILALQVLITNAAQPAKLVLILVRAATPYLSLVVVILQRQRNAVILVINLKLVVQILVLQVLGIIPVLMRVLPNAEIAVTIALTAVLQAAHPIPVLMLAEPNVGQAVIIAQIAVLPVLLPYLAQVVTLKLMSVQPNVVLLVTLA